MPPWLIPATIAGPYTVGCDADDLAYSEFDNRDPTTTILLTMAKLDITGHRYRSLDGNGKASRSVISGSRGGGGGGAGGGGGGVR